MKASVVLGKNESEFILDMNITLSFVVVAALIMQAYSQQSSKPDNSCVEMKAQSGKKYHEIYVPHESNCNKFYQCTDHGLVQLKCLNGLAFSPYIDGCVVKTADNCITNKQWRSLNN